MKAIIGRKMGMTQVFAEDGTIYAVSVVEVLPNVVTQLKTVETDGYNAIQVGLRRTKKKIAPTNQKKGIFAKLVQPQNIHLFELEGDELAGIKLVRNQRSISLKTVTSLTFSGLSKGKGFVGNIKRHHKIGTKIRFWLPTAVAFNGRRTYPNKGFPKRQKCQDIMAIPKQQVLNLKLLKLPEKNAILIKGANSRPNKINRKNS